MKSVVDRRLLLKAALACGLSRGAAAQSGQTEIVNDVDADPRYLACFSTTRSEIVVPIFAAGAVVGEIDVDGSDLGSFDETDARFLEEIAALLAPLRPRQV